MHHEDDNNLSIKQRPVVIYDIFDLPALFVAAFFLASLKRSALVVAPLTHAPLDSIPIDRIAGAAPVTITPFAGTAIIIAPVIGTALRLTCATLFFVRDRTIR